MISNTYRRNYGAERALLDALGEEEAGALAADWHPDGDRPAEQDASDETTEAALAAALGRLEEALSGGAE